MFYQANLQKTSPYRKFAEDSRDTVATSVAYQRPVREGSSQAQETMVGRHHGIHGKGMTNKLETKEREKEQERID